MKPASVVDRRTQPHDDLIDLTGPQGGGDVKAMLDQHIRRLPHLDTVDPHGGQGIQPAKDEVPVSLCSILRNQNLPRIPPLIWFERAQATDVTGVEWVGDNASARQIEFDVARHARRDYLQQATPVDVARNIHRHGMLRWTAHIMAKGALKKVKVPCAEGIPLGKPLDVPGKPVPFLVPGHTTGHTCFLVGDVVISGDALCTGHMVSRTVGPQVLPTFFDHDRDQHLTELRTLSDVPASVMHPGHGPVHRGPVAEAVEIALRNAH